MVYFHRRLRLLTGLKTCAAVQVLRDAPCVSCQATPGFSETRLVLGVQRYEVNKTLGTNSHKWSLLYPVYLDVEDSFKSLSLPAQPDLACQADERDAGQPPDAELSLGIRRAAQALIRKADSR